MKVYKGKVSKGLVSHADGHFLVRSGLRMQRA